MSLIRRTILAAVLIAGFSPAMAQVPAAVPALPDTERRTSYSITASTCACSVGFALYGDSTDYQNWVEVFIDGTRYNYNDAWHGWTITVPTQTLATRARPISDAILTFNTAQTGTVQIVGARRPRRTSQFNENTGVSARNLNQVFTDVIATQRETWDRTNDVTGRALLGQPGTTLGPLPPAGSCVSNFLAFDATGLNPVCTALVNIGALAVPNPSAVNGLTYWTAANGTAVGSTNSLNNGVLVTGSSGIPSISTTIPGPLSFTGLQTFNAGLTVAGNQNVTLQAGSGVLDLSNGTTVSRRTLDGSMVLTSQSGQIITQDMLLLIAPFATNATSSSGRLFNVTDGNAGSGAVTTHATPTVLISRIENIVDNNSHLGEDGPALMVSNTALGGATQQAIGIVGASYAQSTTAADVVGVQGNAAQTGSGGANTAYGGFFLGQATTSGSGSIGVQLQNSNDTGHSKAYVPSTFFTDGPFIVSLDVAYGSTTASNGQANILLRSGGGTVDVGLAILNGTSSADIRTDTTATNILLAGPTAHTNGINLAAGTFSGNAFSSPGFAVNGSGAITGSWSGSVIGAGTGGTGITSYAVGDLIYASASTTLSKLADVATGSALISGGITTAPSWGKIALSTLATQAANTVVGNATSGSAAPTALTMTSCSTTGSAVIWTTNTGFGCNTALLAAAMPVGGLTGLGTGVGAALAINVGSAGAPVTFNGALGTPSSGTVTNLTGTASININGTVGASTPSTGAFTTVAASTSLTTPLRIGGSGTTGTQLTLQTTTGVGTTDSMAFKGGNNGATTFATLQTGSFNLQSGSTYSINGTSVLSGSALGSGVTSSSLTSFGSSPTIASPTFTGTIAASGPFGGWTSYTPTVTAGSGTITTSSATGVYWQVGKTVHYTARAVVTTNGTGSATLGVTLPVASKNEFAAVGKNITTGKIVAGFVAATSNVVNLTDYLGSYPAADGTVIDISGSYEIS